MFALAHAYIASHVCNSYNPLFLLGSILPDYIWNDSSIQTQQNIHFQPNEFYTYVKENHTEMLHFAQGVLLHSNYSKGVDYYSDNTNIGYAMIEGKKIIQSITDIFPLNTLQAWDFSHNIIEAAVDVRIANEHESFLEPYLKSESAIQSNIIGLLSEFSSVEFEITKKAINNLQHFYYRNDMKSENEIISVCLMNIVKRKFSISADNSLKEIKQILRKAMNVTQNSYSSFMEETILSLKNEYKEEFKLLS